LNKRLSRHGPRLGGGRGFVCIAMQRLDRRRQGQAFTPAVSLAGVLLLTGAVITELPQPEPEARIADVQP